jgi:hypothetical protein
MEAFGLRCSHCATRIEAPLELNEFAKLNGEDLQLLRVFLQFEGRIREMEAPLGLSYPTIRNRIAELKDKVLQKHRAEKLATSSYSQRETASQLLENLRSGKASFEEVLQKMKEIKGTK